MNLHYVSHSFKAMLVRRLDRTDWYGVVTFVLNNPSAGATIFRSSRETVLAGGAFAGDEHGPRLLITAVPEPTGLAMLLLGSFGLLLVRKRG